MDGEGVLRWADNGEELALFGVNYYAPFAMDYHELKKLNGPIENVIDRDVQHLARLGLDAMRLHVWDREISDREGKLLDNDHLRLLDYLIATNKSWGIYTVLTPIAWWGTTNPSDGFSNHFTMAQMIADPAARKAQRRYLAEFVQHVNPHTKLSYADDPAVVVFELINEPICAPGTSDAQITEYINALAEAIRATGCKKPLFYNGWGDRLGAVRDSTIDGCTFGWYPTGLVSGRSLRANGLLRVEDYPSMRSESLRGKGKIVYEFDAADVPGCYMYPAMARAFRGGGAQIATQFQYDALPLAPSNINWQTHYLNLVCTPNKALSFMIAGEVFHRLPRLKQYGKYPDNRRFGDFRVDYEQDLCELVTVTEFIYANSTTTRPPDPVQLRRIAGCGSSDIVLYEGTGTYFLDRLSPGVWRLEVYPDAVWVNDPFGKPSMEREVCRVLWRSWPMEVKLADLGNKFSVQAVNEGNTLRPVVQNGRFEIRPGVYLLSRERTQVAGNVAGTRVGMREFFAPAEQVRPVAVRHDAAQEWVAGKAMPVTFTVAADREPEQVALRVGEQELPLSRKRAYQYTGAIPSEWLKEGTLSYELKGIEGRWAVPILKALSPVVLFDARRHQVRTHGSAKCSQQLVPGKDGGKAMQLSVQSFDVVPNAVSFRNELDDELDPRRDELKGMRVLRVRARALETVTKAVEVVVLERDGTSWGVDVPLSTEWQDIRVPIEKLRCYKHWGTVPDGRGKEGDRLQPGNISGVSVCFGAWLYPQHVQEPHTIEIESISLE